MQSLSPGHCWKEELNPLEELPHSCGNFSQNDSELDELSQNCGNSRQKAFVELECALLAWAEPPVPSELPPPCVLLLLPPVPFGDDVRTR